jgi:peptide/nickel transport system ATP-binding protein
MDRNTEQSTNMGGGKVTKPTPLLSIRNLEVTFTVGDRRIEALRGLDLDLHRGMIHALVGESGSGKSVSARSILGLLPKDRANIRAATVTFDGESLLNLGEGELREIRGSRISMIFQEPAKHLNPALRIGRQIGEVVRVHMGASAVEAYNRTVELMELVGLATNWAESQRILRSYPHELSGGMKQRAMVAMALSCEPDLLIADEPTTALDVTVQRQIINLIRDINDRLGMTVLFISHDLSVVHEISDDVSVIYAGKIIEHASSDEVFHHPRHPYTKLLLASIPDPDRRGERLISVPGTVPDAEEIPRGCAFHVRCPYARERCSAEIPDIRPYVTGQDDARTVAVETGGEVHEGACHYMEEIPDVNAEGENP